MQTNKILKHFLLIVLCMLTFQKICFAEYQNNKSFNPKTNTNNKTSKITTNKDVEPIIVLASTKPIYNLCAAVLDNNFKMHLLIKGNKSPHNFSLLPRDIKIINKANVIVWGGEKLEPYLKKIIANKKDNTLKINITNAKNLTLLPMRSLKSFINNNNNNNKHKKHSSNCGSCNKVKSHSHHKCNSSKPCNFDPHIWLSPYNGIKIAYYIKEEIIKKYPRHEKLINNNFENFEQKLTKLDKQIKKQLNEHSAKSFLVFHDAFQYFEKHYNLSNKGAITFDPEIPLSAKKLLQIEEQLKNYKIHCIFREPQFNGKIVFILCALLKIKEGMLNPLGNDKDLGKDGYLILLKNLANNFSTCLK